MSTVILSLVLIIGGLIIGQIVKTLSMRNEGAKRAVFEKIIKSVRNLSFFILTPFVVLNAFWMMDFSNIKIISVPFIGISALIFGMLLALLSSKLFKHNKKDKGAMFCLGSSTNIGSIGALLCYTVFGEAGFIVCALYKIFELPFYYLFVYPVASNYSQNKKNARKQWYMKLITDPIIQVYIGSIIIGIVLNIFNANRPSFLKSINEILIPLSSFLLIVAVGYTMRFSRVSEYKKEIAVISTIKYIATPIFVILVSILLGLNKMDDLVVFKTLIILSALPCGFNSLIPVQMYKLNVDLANSCWLVTTGLLLQIFPIIWMIVG